MDQEEHSQSNWARLKILSETKWYRVYESDGGVPVTVSKFITDEIELSEALLRDEWPSWTLSDRVLFAQAFAQKSSFTAKDEAILDFLVAANDPPYIQVVIAPALPRHPDRNRAASLLLARLESGSGPQTNTISALLNIAATGSARRPEIVKVLKTAHARLATLTRTAGVASRGAQAENIQHILDFIACSAALASLENLPAYLDRIRSFTIHPNQAIAAAAANYLDKVQQAWGKLRTSHPDNGK